MPQEKESGLNVRRISKCTVYPSSPSTVTAKPGRCELTPWDMAMLSVHYIQKGLLFAKPSPPQHHEPFIQRLHLSLSHTLSHFFPLAGRLATQRHDDGASVFVDCNSTGADFIHATADISLSDILDSIDVPPIVKSFFCLDGAVNHDGHSLPLLVVQVTELKDGIFIGCSFNHSVGDGTSFWHFFNSWSEICRSEAGCQHISRPPIIERWFLDHSPLRIPSSEEEFLERYSPPPLRERIFHFSWESVSRLKAKANEQRNTDRISSFQALSAHMWRSVTRARGFPDSQMTCCRLAAGNRSRLELQLQPEYFGNCIQAIGATATAGELLDRDLGWAAWLIHDSVVAHDNIAVRKYLEAWVNKAFIFQLSGFDAYSIKMGSSPRFDVYGNDFGWGKPVAVRSGHGNKFNGKITSYPGREGGGSVDLEVCLLPETMAALISDREFMEAVHYQTSFGFDR